MQACNSISSPALRCLSLSLSSLLEFQILRVPSKKEINLRALFLPTKEVSPLEGPSTPPDEVHRNDIQKYNTSRDNYC